MDIRQDPESGLIDFDKGVLFTTSSMQDSLRQRLDIRLKTQRGTVFTNIYYGIDWLNDAFGDGSTRQLVDGLIQSEILKEPLVDKIIRFSSNIDRLSRTYICSFAVLLLTGEVSDTITLLANENSFVLIDVDNTAIKAR